MEYLGGVLGSVGVGVTLVGLGWRRSGGFVGGGIRAGVLFSGVVSESGMSSDPASTISSFVSASVAGISEPTRPDSQLLGASGCACERSSRTCASGWVGVGSAWPSAPASGNLR